MEVELDTSDPDFILVNGCRIYVNESLRRPILEEYEQDRDRSAILQFAAAQRLPGLSTVIGLPDFHAGYALPIGSVAVVDLDHPKACVSPDGVGFDINCGVRCLRTNLTTADLSDEKKNMLADLLLKEVLFEEKCTMDGEAIRHINCILDRGMDYLLDLGIVTKDDIECTESHGSLPGNSRLVGQAAKSRGISQLGTLGSGNHYLEIQVVERIFDEETARCMGVSVDQVLVTIHTGSRGLGHKCCSDVLKEISTGSTPQKTMGSSKCSPGSLEFVPYSSEIGQKYMSIMYSASNFAWANRSVIADRARKCFSEVLPGTKLEMVCDVCHNVAKVEDLSRVLVHRKGASRVLPPGHPELPERYVRTGQPVPVGGSMGTHSYLIAGAPGCTETYFSTCHGAGRLISRSLSKKMFSYENVVNDMKKKGILFRTGSEGGMVEECSECYKDVDAVVEHSERVGITRTVCRVRPILVIKG